MCVCVCVGGGLAMIRSESPPRSSNGMLGEVCYIYLKI